MAIHTTSNLSQAINEVELTGLTDKIRPNVVALNVLRRRRAPKAKGSFKVAPKLSSGPSLDSDTWLDEGQSKPVKNIVLQRESITMRKIGFTSVWSEELEEDAFLNPRSIIQPGVRVEARARGGGAIGSP